MLALIATGTFVLWLLILYGRGSPVSVHGFYEPKTWNGSLWGIRPVRDAYSPYAVDGHGSDDFAGYDLYAEDPEAGMLKPYYSAGPSSENSSPKDQAEVDLPPTSRNLLANDDENMHLEQSPRNLEQQIMHVIGENRQTTALRKPALDGTRVFGLPDQLTGLGNDSAGSNVDNVHDVTIPQLSRDNDSILADTNEKQPKTSQQLLEGGEQEAFAITACDRGTDMSRDEETDRKEKRYLYLRRLARKRINLAEKEVAVAARYNTLFHGLRKNTERDAAVLHLLSFVLRRVIFAVLIVGLASLLLTSTIVFLVMTFAVLAIACHEQQWEHWLINQ